jgi:hypothetical protein
MTFFQKIMTIQISDWKPLDDGWICILCTDGRKHTTANTPQHKKSAFHQTLIEEATRREHAVQTAQAASNEERPSMALPSLLALVDSATCNLLVSVAEPYTRVADRGSNDPEHSAPEPELSPVEGWGLFEANDNTYLAQALEQQGIALIARSLLDRFDEISVGSLDDGDERSEVDEDEVPEPIVPGMRIPISALNVIYNLLGDNDGNTVPEPPLKRACNVRNDASLDPSVKWFPWHDKIVSKLPSVYSNILTL